MRLKRKQLDLSSGSEYLKQNWSKTGNDLSSWLATRENSDIGVKCRLGSACAQANLKRHFTTALKCMLKKTCCKQKKIPKTESVVSD